MYEESWLYRKWIKAILLIGMSMAKEQSKTFIMLYSTSKQPDNRIKGVKDQKECKK